MPEYILPPKRNTVFQLLFGDPRNIELLADFLKSVLDIPEDEYREIVIVNPNLPREYPDRKLGIVDLRVTTRSGQIIHVEIQREPVSAMRNRLVFYDAGLITGQIGESEKYSALKRVISIIIADYPLIPESPLYHHRFTLYDPQANIEFSDLIEIHTLELSKIPETPDVYLCNWLRFFRAETRKELDMVANASPAIQKATARVLMLSEDERARLIHEYEVRAKRDELARLDYAMEKGIEKGRQEGREEGMERGKLETARAMFAEGDSIEKIARVTGISQETLKAGLS